MKDICFLSGLVIGAGIGMIVAAKNKQIKKIVDCGEQCVTDAVNEVKQAAIEPICECANKTQKNEASNTKTSRTNGKKQSPQNKEK